MATGDREKDVPTTLTDDEIKTVRQKGRRSFLRALGLGFIGATAGIGMFRPTRASDSDSGDTSDSDEEDSEDSDTGDAKAHHDFPKGRDGDVTENADLKFVDSDDHNSKEVDSNRNRLRDAQGSTDSD